ncbi:unknown [Mycoplasma sp. CAG:956]|nr:unknown [Mycoplasma sp. CAG:956]
MKIEKLNENSLKKYINDMELDYKLNISRGYFGIKKDDKFIFGYDFSTDWIDVSFKKDVDQDTVKETLNFLKNEISPDKSLVVEVVKTRVINIMNKLYETKEATVSKRINNIHGDFVMKEKVVVFKDLKIKYFDIDNNISCNLKEQNMENEEVINYLDKYFTSLKVSVINFIVSSKCLDYIKNLGYEEGIMKYIVD